VISIEASSSEFFLSERIESVSTDGSFSEDVNELVLEGKIVDDEEQQST